ncbi:MAG: 1-(5-phosphoribosyl)-5-[(5-phosphoribosylamino)methylideneamino]imidazole-4-carboxamide isomerase [Aminipila sp.]
MNIYPAIDLYKEQAVRLIKGNFNDMTVYSNDPVSVAISFQEQGAENLHIVDLEGAKHGATSNFSTIKNIVQNTDLFIQVGGGIRNIQTIEKYIALGVNRIILGTAAITNDLFLQEALSSFGDKIAVGVDIKDNKVATNGWSTLSDYSLDDYCDKLEYMGVKTIICTDISKDGAMQGPNIALYQALSKRKSMQTIASGGVSGAKDIELLCNANIYGAILGKALYTNALSICEAIKISKRSYL